MHYLAVAAMVCAMSIFTSCKKEPLPLPEVIESEVYDNGTAGEVTTTPMENGVEMSYESWINVRGVTKGTFDNKVSVVLYANAQDVILPLDVATWNMGEFVTSTTHEVGESRTEGFVTIVDSALVYTVSCDRFEFSYRLHYEVGTYDDGVSRQVMPYHYFKNIRDNGGVLEDAESYVDGEAAYARKIYRHSITVDFGGESYDVEAVITLRRILGPASEPYPLTSELVKEEIEPLVSQDGFLVSAWVKSKLSTGETVTDQFSTKTYVYTNENNMDLLELNCKRSDISFINANIEYVDKSSGEAEEDDFLVYTERYKCILDYGYFNMEIDLLKDQAVFDNGVLVTEVGKTEFDASKVVVKETWIQLEETETTVRYLLDFDISVPLGGLTFEGGCNRTIVVSK